MRKIIIILIFIIIGYTAVNLYLINNPKVNFILNIAGITSPECKEKRDLTVRLGKQNKLVRLYSPYEKTKSCIMLIPGFSHLGIEHESLNMFAKSLCEATGKYIVIPEIDGLKNYKIDLTKTSNEIREIYKVINKEITGTYDIYSFCISSIFLQIALEEIPKKIYPKKVFFLGTFSNGKKIIESFNTVADENASSEEKDIIGKLVLAYNSTSLFRSDELSKIKRALFESNIGTTDTEISKKVLGNELTSKIKRIYISNREVEKLNIKKIGQKFNLIDTEYFIAHAKGDNIIDYHEGEDVYKYLKERGANVHFLLTGIVEHSTSNLELSMFINEFNNLEVFLDLLLYD